jgi:hypothetical protein
MRNINYSDLWEIEKIFLREMALLKQRWYLYKCPWICDKPLCVITILDDVRIKVEKYIMENLYEQERYKKFNQFYF